MRIEKYLYSTPTGVVIDVPVPDGSQLQLSFSNALCGSPERAIEKAREYRDFLLNESGQLWKLERHAGMERNIANKTGIIGVSTEINLKGEHSHKNWVATGDLAGVRWKKKFAVKRYSESGAFLWACRERYKRHGPLVILDADRLPCLPDVPYRIQPFPVRAGMACD